MVQVVSGETPADGDAGRRLKEYSRVVESREVVDGRVEVEI